jgi:hypothetical protein
MQMTLRASSGSNPFADAGGCMACGGGDGEDRRVTIYLCLLLVYIYVYILFLIVA